MLLVAQTAKPSRSFNVLMGKVLRARTLWLIAEDHGGHHVAVARLAVVLAVLKGFILIIEAQQKTHSREWKAHHSPEEASGIWSLSTYSWLVDLFLSGFKSILTMDDLYALDGSMSASNLQAKIEKQRLGNLSTGKPASLNRQLFSALSMPLLLPVVPRLAVIGFTFCQPFLMETVLQYLQSPGDANHGYGLIAATIIIYGGIAISNALYFYWQERFACMVRGILFTAIYDKTVSLPADVAANSTALTLMNSDVERVKMGLLPIHEYWANAVELALACWLLEQRIGVAFVAPIAVVIVCILASSGVASATGRRQVAWMQAIEERVTATAVTISSMKPLRISGMTVAVENLIQALRHRELKIGGKWRLMLVIAVTLSFTPMTIGPLMAFAATSRTLEVTRIFPAMAFITLLAAPLVSLFQNIPALMSAIACLGRINAYVKLDSRMDSRTTLQPIPPAAEKTGAAQTTLALEVKEGHFGWSQRENILRHVNFAVPASSLIVIVGPVASGKSTLLKALLSETTFCSGEIAFGVNSRIIGFCDQTPFLLNDTIRANIVGNSQPDETRYQQALHATALVPDLSKFSQGDHTKVGDGAISLSGGQKQRLALARALYSKAELYLLDDVLSGLDVSTSALVFQRTLGPGGLLRQRKATVIFCTHDERYLPFADKVLTINASGLISERISVTEAVFRSDFQRLRGYDGPVSSILGETKEATDNTSESNHSTEADRPATTRQQDASRQMGDFSVSFTFDITTSTTAGLGKQAPLYAHFIETLSGLITLRALGLIDVAMATSSRLLDMSQRPSYLLAMIQRWLQLVLRMIVMLLAVIVVTLATQLRTDSGFTGATLLTLMAFGDMLATIVQSYTTLETSIGAVARLKTFSSSTEIESQPDEYVEPDAPWPERGQIEIRDVTASYRSADGQDFPRISSNTRSSGEISLGTNEIALRDLNLTFAAGERTAIVGRTGSLGLITIDGISLKTVDRDVLRRRVIAVSQDPVFLPPCSCSTLRSNLDPFGEAPEHDILASLKLLGLEFLMKDEGSSDPTSETWELPFSHGSLSQGHKQLFSLARAVVRLRIRQRSGACGGLLILDEVSSSVDSQTDEKMLRIIQQEFAGYTVIMIAHRLDLAMTCDQVLVMEEGRVCESGQPSELSSREGGKFKMLMDTGEFVS
ncbi:canalicular multispecific organic anion transporter 2 [Verticillium alfalfae VaMs.102]|uniref:Canalicular multispecific organic anion transporter 2 n=1 Tax=Verticillium alfalfae (strain VaMs.102 / ATCC MYA-4576 / FGSC 10136) TaxID=526221 RepID=C9STW4_VERA1|nr:canalicular multispecific organic anion transporter 2 [Verticillium alfalfae VaMs.102]EEY22275.1 canalicular multispecific organic anion transporter 2 [Verticillium alfalfae VaMs.102]